ncbi:DNA adenine methylase [Lacipirellula parvula]|uniref:site-specific DNA-methyltransferase (adenine-specific) n=1 Tax=Lacipirellula parvula TaxID=2650471 RepID=A0A5K7X8V5_9BACT|nr:Dam family site-specific DNA-(adenine-N6)-methyltransferase [Lacipirellula parvula]BBO30726.1 hypothetical protein PLANPX_0338 [Lacipirellula parvula]
MTTPLFRWAGSKRKSLPTLAEFWQPTFRRYVEPFVGSAALFFRLQPRRALLSDINKGLIEAYKVIRDQPDDLHAAVCAIPRRETTYYKIRAQRPADLTPFERAVRFVYLNRYCFNGIYRTNAKGEFNVPFAHNKPGVIPSIEQFRQCSILLSKTSLRCGDFESVLSAVREGDFVYLDPPYAVESRRIFRQYDAKEFTLEDMERLSKCLRSIDGIGASFVISYADCAEARRLLKRWKPVRHRVRRHIAGFASARRTAFELLATNIEAR